MNKRIMFIGMSLILLFHPCSLDAQDVSLGLKVGIQYSRLTSIDKGSGIHDSRYPKYSRIPHFSAELFSDLKLTSFLLFRTGLCLHKLTSYIILIGFHDEYAIQREFSAVYIRIPLLLKLKFKRTSSPYLLSGVDIGYLAEGNLKSWNLYSYLNPHPVKGDVILVKTYLPTIDFSASIGLGQDFVISGMIFFVDTKLLMGLTHYRWVDGDDPSSIGSWKNTILQVGIGCFFK